VLFLELKESDMSGTTAVYCGRVIQNVVAYMTDGCLLKANVGHLTAFEHVGGNAGK